MKAHFFYKLMATVLSTVFVASCICTKKKCDDMAPPKVTVVFQHFPQEELENILVIRTGKINYTSIDTVRYRDFHNNETIDMWDLDYSYIIQTGSTRDTVKDISYERYTQSMHCNRCFPFGHEDRKVSRYKNFSFTHERVLYFEDDTLKISK